MQLYRRISNAVRGHGFVQSTSGELRAKAEEQGLRAKSRTGAHVSVSVRETMLASLFFARVKRSLVNSINSCSTSSLGAGRCAQVPIASRPQRLRVF